MSLRWTSEQLAEYQNRQQSSNDFIKHIEREKALDQCGAKHGLTPKQGKYRNKPVVVDNLKFDSKREAARWQQLKMMEKAGMISELTRQVPFELAPSVIIRGRKKPALTYRADFTYRQDGLLVVEDSKGVVTKEYSIKRHLMKSVHNIDIVEV